MRLSFPHFLFVTILLIFTSCEQNKWEVDTSSLAVSLEFERFELDLFDKVQDGFDRNEIVELNESYPNLFPLYIQAIMRFGDPTSVETLEILHQFATDPDIKELLKKIKTTYPRGSLQKEMQELEEGLKNFSYYFPNRVVPKVKTMLSAFSYSTVVDDSLLVIGLDTYLGGDFPIYSQTGIPKYKFEKFSKEYMVSDALKAWLLTEFEDEGGKNLAEQMIFQGKILYLLEAFLPHIDKPYLFNYFPEELNWCNDNEAQIWFHFVDMELLYSTENYQIKKYLGDAPFVSGFPEGSPGRVGQWIGYRIVSAYMERKSELNLKDLMQMQDYNQILQQSKYKPNR